MEKEKINLAEVDAILNAEKEAETFLVKAKTEKEKLINDSKKKALETVTQEKEKITDSLNKLLAEEKKKLEKEQKKILKEAKSQTANLQALAKKNQDKAEEIVFNSILKGGESGAKQTRSNG